MNLIINADDFGISERANSTTLYLHKLGIVTSTTIISASEYFDQAVLISKDNQALGIGVHLCLDGPFKIGKGYLTLTDKITGDFYNNYQIIRKLKLFSIDESEIFREYCYQVEKVLDHSIRISHLDSHHHLHMYLPSLRSMIKVAKKYKIPYIRTQKVLLRENQSVINYLYRNIHQILLKSRVKAADGLFEPSINDISSFEKEYIRFSKLMTLKNGIIEIMLHPRGINDPETSFITSERMRSLLKNHNLINYNDIK